MNIHGSCNKIIKNWPPRSEDCDGVDYDELTLLRITEEI
jgi:hypothetical protein